MKRWLGSALRNLFLWSRSAGCILLYWPTSALAELFPAMRYLKWLLLSCAATRSIEMDDLPLAKSRAQELLSLSAAFPQDWNHDNALHKAHSVLGRIALREGKPDEAALQLIQSAQIDGSPQLDTFGPNMVLARECLAAGRQDAVLEYFNLCRSFWKLGRGKLDRWQAIVRAGGTPEFGANIYY